MSSSIVVAHAPNHRPQDLVVEHAASRVAVVLSRGSFEVFVKTRYDLGSVADAKPGEPTPISLARCEEAPPLEPADIESSRAVTSGGGATEARLDPAGAVLAFSLAVDGEGRGPRDLRAQLPADRPRLLTTAATALARDTELSPALHRVHVDGKLRVVDLVHRGVKELEHPRGADVDSIVVAFVDDGWDDAPDPNLRWSRPRRDLPRGRFERAWSEADVAARTAPEPLDEGELAMARYSTWGFELAPLPSMKVERYARIQAELCEERRPRPEVLESHGLTEYAFSVEEIAFSQLSAEVPEAAEDGGEEPPPGFAERYGAAFAREQARLEDPAEASRTAEDYARVVVALGSSDPRRAFSDQGMGLGAFMRLEQRLNARASHDPAFGQALEDAIEAERARVAEAKASKRAKGGGST